MPAIDILRSSTTRDQTAPHGDRALRHGHGGSFMAIARPDRVIEPDQDEQSLGLAQHVSDVAGGHKRCLQSLNASVPVEEKVSIPE